MSKLINNPELFIKTLETEFDKYVQKKLTEKSDEWFQRNNDCVSGSALSVCARQAWYYYHLNQKTRFNGDYGKTASRRMFYGFLSEFIHELVLKESKDNLEFVTLHMLQGEFPVTQRIEVNNITFSATTDFVLEYVDSNQSFYIPLELKTTSIKMWNKFTHFEYHVKQLMLWIHYAKKQNLNIPFGILKYDHFTEADTKFVIVNCDIQAHPIGVYYDYVKSAKYLDELVNSLAEKINKKTLPDIPHDVPEFKCRICLFRELCKINATDITALIEELYGE
jgi:hypothetical protein